MTYTISAHLEVDNGDIWDLEDFRLLRTTITSSSGRGLTNEKTGLALLEWTHSQTGETTWQTHQVTLTALGAYPTKAEALAAMGATGHDL